MMGMTVALVALTLPSPGCLALRRVSDASQGRGCVLASLASPTQARRLWVDGCAPDDN